MDDQLKTGGELISRKVTWKERLSTVTPFSKYLALFLFIAFLFASFYAVRMLVVLAPTGQSTVNTESALGLGLLEAEKEVPPETKDAVNTPAIKTLPVITLEENGTYLNFNATSSKYAPTDARGDLKLVDGKLYADKENAYLLKEIVNDCTDAVEDKLIKIEVTNTNPLELSFANNNEQIIKSADEVLVNFLKVEADRASFSYVGEMYYAGGPMENSTYTLYRDKERVFIIKSTYKACEGISMADFTDTAGFAHVDIPTFQYLGKDPDETYETNTSYAKDKNYFYWYRGILSNEITPKTCTGDFFKKCFPEIKAKLKTSD